ncbi:MAG: hypothetical protein D6677_06500 [Calditrichaeota bacterium]|nr:MAG: hypothetical protein D6677_06500 [Calditrichota bacterium]
MRRSEWMLTILLILFGLYACDRQNDTLPPGRAGSSADGTITDARAAELLNLQLRVQRHPGDTLTARQWKQAAYINGKRYVWGFGRQSGANRAMVLKATQIEARRALLALDKDGDGRRLQGRVAGLLTEVLRLTRGDSLCVLYAVTHNDLKH